MTLLVAKARIHLTFETTDGPRQETVRDALPAVGPGIFVQADKCPRNPAERRHHGYRPRQKGALAGHHSDRERRETIAGTALSRLPQRRKLG